MSNKLSDKDISFLMNMTQGVIDGLIKSLKELLPKSPLSPDGVLADSQVGDEVTEVKQRILNIAKHCRAQTKDAYLRGEITNFIHSVNKGIEVHSAREQNASQANQPRDDRN